MGVRVKLRIKVRGREAETAALVNTGFETEKPELLIPAKLASRLGLYPPPTGTEVGEYGTVGGPVIMLRVPAMILVQMMYERRSPPIDSVAVISTLEQEVLISDTLAEELRIVILSPARGLWRFQNDKPGRIRRSARPKYWS